MTQFLANESIFEPMLQAMKEASQRILDAIKDGQRIIVRHHNDTDGYCSGFMLEKAIIPLIIKYNERRNAPFEKFRRMPLHTPYYGVEDVMRDTAQMLQIKSRFNEKLPLVIIADLGSGPENVYAIKQLHALGVEVIIIDHHPIDETVDSLVKHHINLHKYNAPNELAAGIICAELGRVLNPNIKHTAVASAVAAIGDRVEEEYATPYLKLAENFGFSKEHITKIAQCIDFSVYFLRSIDCAELLTTLFSKSGEALVDVQIEELTKRKAEVLAEAQTVTNIEKLGNHTLIHIEIDKMERRDYPRMGLIADIVKEDLIESGQVTGDIVLMGTTEELVLCRATDDSSFDFPTLLAQVKEEFGANGGGHPHAGTFKVVAAKHAQALQKAKEYVSSL